MSNFILFIVSVLLSIIFVPLGFLYALFRKFREFGKYLFQIAFTIDQSGNTIMQHFFNDVLIKEDGAKFGNPDETISSVMGRNQQKGTLRTLGKFLNWILNKIDPNHSIDAIGN